MVTLARTERLKLPLAPALAIAGGLLIAVAMLVLPTALLERLVVASGFPSVIAAAQPPLGLTARIALGLILGGGFMAFACIALSLLFGDRTLNLAKAGTVLRGTDIHPDAPPRPPLFAARDLGTPFLEVKAPVDGAAPVARDPLDMTPIEQELPRDLDRPLSDFDPGAILMDPLPAAENLAPLAPTVEAVLEESVIEPVAADPIPLPRPALFDPGDRFETFELTPTRPIPLPTALRADPIAPVVEAAIEEIVTPVAAPEPVVAPETEATVHDLLARLERGIASRPVAAAPTPIRPVPVVVTPEPAPASSLAGTLGDLRRMATGGR